MHLFSVLQLKYLSSHFFISYGHSEWHIVPQCNMTKETTCYLGNVISHPEHVIKVGLLQSNGIFSWSNYHRLRLVESKYLKDTKLTIQYCTSHVTLTFYVFSLFSQIVSSRIPPVFHHQIGEGYGFQEAVSGRAFRLWPEL